MGEDARWIEGLDLLGPLGLHVALIPHYDNAEGGTHDTRFSYLGEERLARLEDDLPEGVFVLGVDEHTALCLDLDAGTALVAGRGGVTVRARGHSARIESGQTLRHRPPGRDGRRPGPLVGARPARCGTADTGGATCRAPAPVGTGEPWPTPVRRPRLAAARSHPGPRSEPSGPPATPVTRRPWSRPSWPSRTRCGRGGPTPSSPTRWTGAGPPADHGARAGPGGRVGDP